MPCVRWVVFAPGFFHVDAALWQLGSPSPTAGWAWHETPRTFCLHKCAHSKFTVYGPQATKHKHARAQCSRASVGLAQACPSTLLCRWTIKFSFCSLALHGHSAVPVINKWWIEVTNRVIIKAWPLYITFSVSYYGNELTQYFTSFVT